jgi:FkbM family methyltransferase
MVRLAGLVSRPIAVSQPSAFLPPGRLQAVANRARNRLTPAIAKRRNRFLVRALASLSTLYLDMVANRCYEVELNGESRVLHRIAAHGASCIFDVGANIGDWSAAAAAAAPNADVHAFEIISDTAQRLQERVARAGLTRVTVNELGLSDQDGTIEVAYLPEFSEGSSAAIIQPVGTSELRLCHVQTGDEYCRAHGINHIDFLKLDVEGHEAKVLKGFGAMLSEQKVDAVQFEYGYVNAAVRFLLGDFYELFESYGYAVGKIYPDGVDFRDYDPWRDEDFRGPNYLAVRATKTDLIRRLAGADGSP